jgi:UDP-galactopyranose mutase
MYSFSMFCELGLKEAIAEADLIVVGSGFFGATIAERAAELNSWNVLVLDKRENVGGNAFSYFDNESGVEVHKYGSHLFHTNSEEVWAYINNFSSFNDYRHKVISNSGGMTYPFPINLQTLSMIYGRVISPTSAQSLLNQDKNPEAILSFEDAALNVLPEVLYRKFYEGYTRKQWQKDPSELSSEIFSRIPIRLDYNEAYFSDKYQGLPTHGYQKIFENMLKSKLINVKTSTNFFDVKDSALAKRVVYTGPIDEFFNYSFGELDWRTLDFEFETIESNDYQGCSVMNYPDEQVPFTRIHEFKHLHPERENLSGKTVIAREYSRPAKKGDEPFYPVNTSRNREILHKYRTEAKKLPEVIFGGRLGSFQYLDMHMAIASALSTFRNQLWERREKP